jgi:hypothetical protein
MSLFRSRHNLIKQYPERLVANCVATVSSPMKIGTTLRRYRAR